MRNLDQIIDSVKVNENASEEELRYGLLAVLSLLNFDHRDLRKELTKEKRTPELFRKMKAEESYKRYHKALNISPKEWLGWDNDPENPEYQRRLEIGNKLLDKV